MDFTDTVLDTELGYLVMAGSSVPTIADTSRLALQIGVTRGSLSETMLPGILANATIIPTPSLGAVGEMLSSREICAYATIKPILAGMADHRMA